MLQPGGHNTALAGCLDDGLGQRAGQQVGLLRGDDLLADDVTHGAARAGGAGVDISLQTRLVVGELALDRRLVEVLHPALGCVDGGTLLGGVQKRRGVQRDGGLEVHASRIAVLLEAGIQRRPGVELGVGVNVLGGEQAAAKRFLTVKSGYGPVEAYSSSY